VFGQQPQPPSPVLDFLKSAAVLGVPNWVLIGIVLMLLLLGALFLLGKVPVSYNLLNLRVRWRTTAMTALAFTLVIGLLTVMLAFVNGMWALTAASGQPGNVLVMSQGSTDETFSDLGFSDLGDIENQPLIVREDGKPLVSRETYLIVNQPIKRPRYADDGRAAGLPMRRFLQLRGLDDPALSGTVHGLSLYAGGEWFSEAGVREHPGAEQNDGPPAVECVLGEGIARVLASDLQDASGNGPGSLAVGDTFRLNDRSWLVVGILQSSGSTFDSEVWAKRSLIGPMFGKSSYSTLVCRAKDAQSAEQLAQFYKTGYTKASLNSITEAAYFAGLNEYNTVLLYAIVFVTVILAVGGVFGVMNTMFAAISQRTKDIGVFRLMGYRRRHILASFLREALVIGLIGGIAGCALGSLVDGWSATSILNSGRGGGGRTVVLHLTVDAAVICSGLLLTLLMGLVGGLVPSLNAMRLTALDALR